MLALVNEALMSYGSMKVIDTRQRPGKMYIKLRVMTSNKLLQPESSVRGRNGSKKSKPDTTSPRRVETDIDPLVPVNREILRISAPLKHIKDISADKMADKNFTVPISWKECPMSINVNAPGKFSNFSTEVDVRCHEQGEDRANVYVIAFPFNGLIKPLEEDPRYRIYKGFISSSAKPFFFNNRKYRKILYLVIEVNKHLFEKDHKFYTPVIPVTIESYALFTNREGAMQTNHERMTLNIKSANGDYTTEWFHELLDKPVYMTAKPGEDLWVTYDFKASAAAKADNKSKRTHKNKSHNQPKSYTVSGNTLVTTNKHGIRKEVTLGRDKPKSADEHKQRPMTRQPGGQNRERNRRGGQIKLKK